MGKQYNPWDPCYQLFKSLVSIVGKDKSDIEILFELVKYKPRNKKYHKDLNDIDCLKAVLADRKRNKKGTI